MVQCPTKPSRSFFALTPSTLLGLLCSTASVAHAAPIPLQQAPWGMSSGPAPNIIISVDNSTSMGSLGIAALKSALRATFSTTNVPDDKIRLAWQAMHGCNTLPGTNTAANGPCRGFNGMRRFSGTHRSNFEQWIDSISSVRGTPTHWVMSNAGDYLSATNLGINSPWAYHPGVAEGPVLACRRSYHILMTDGEYGHSAWNAGEVDMSGPNGVRIVRGGNADGTNTTLPDGTLYSATDNQTRLYRDAWGSASHSSLSDLAFYYWSRDLQPGIPNGLRPPPGQITTSQNFGTTSQPAWLQPYWNPRNNPATWQHMVTYTIGFLNAASWSGSPTWSGDTFVGLGGLINGTTSWVTPFCDAQARNSGNHPCDGGTNYERRASPRKADLWHTALNSRGRYVPAPTAQDLVVAFENILGEITTHGGSGTVSIAGTSGRHRSSNQLYLASYDSENWRGDVQAWTDSGNTPASAPDWRASTWLDQPGLDTTTRRMFTHSETGGVALSWNEIGALSQNRLTAGDSTTLGQQRLGYLRGDHTHEIRNGGTLRNRSSRLGSIVNSNLWVTPPPRRLAFEMTGHADFRSTQNARATAVYVGANDGMLHGFDASSGSEIMAYVPRGVFPSLRDYTAPDFTYRATVDGSPFTGDADIRATPNEGGPNWRTLLVGGLGAGGRGYFVLDVTAPGSFSANSVLLDRTLPPGGSVTTDEQFTGHQDVGHLMAPALTDGPLTQRTEQIVKLNNGRWALVTGNGINSANERPVLLIQYLDGDRSLHTIVANNTTGTGNGLAPARLIDVDGNGTMDIAYAGDRRGQLWKFNLQASDPAQWGVSVWDGSGATCRDGVTCQPFLRVTQPNGDPTPQPITTAPIWMPHPLGGIQLLFGTGELLQAADATNTQTQTVFSVWDMSGYVPRNGSTPGQSLDEAPLTGSTIRNRLVAQPVGNAIPVTDTSGVQHSDQYHESGTNPVVYSRTAANAPRGWYVDLPVAGERVLVHPQPFLGRKAIFTTTAPSANTALESCNTDADSGRHWLNVRDMITGQAPAGGVFYSSTVTTNLDRATRVSVPSNEFVLRPAQSENGVNRFGINWARSRTEENARVDGIIDRAPAPARASWQEIAP